MDVPEKSHKLLETFATVIITLATVSTAWCAYQSNIWSGVQEFEMHDAAAINRQSTFLRTEANQQRTVDVELFTSFVEARLLHRDSIELFYRNRMPPRLHRALEAWLATNPFVNNTAPPHPFAMKEYVLVDVAKADSLDNEYGKYMERAEVSNTHSDDYVLLTVMFASVMFFGGISSNIQDVGTKRWVVLVSTILLVVAVVWMATFPISFS